MSLVPSYKANLAVIDSGVGGLSVLAELRRILPYNSIIYYADTLNCPYGERSKQEIIELSFEVVERVIAMGAKVVVIACNTMTAAAITQLRQRWSEVEFVGMEPAVKPALLSSRSGVVGVLATPATLKGELYRTTKQNNQHGQLVIEVGGVGLVEFVERMEQDSQECEELVRRYVEPMLEQGADRIVLGCTHYPFLTSVIKKVVLDYSRKNGIEENSVEIINPAPAVVRRVCEVLRSRGLLLESQLNGDLNLETSSSISTPNEEDSKRAEVFYFSSGSEEDLDFLSKFLDRLHL